MKNIIKMIETRIERLNDQAGLFINRGEEVGMRLAIEELEKIKKEILITLLREAKEQKMNIGNKTILTVALANGQEAKIVSTGFSCLLFVNGVLEGTFKSLGLVQKYIAKNYKE